MVINGSNSKWTDVTSGIPRGSVLGPILFTIYINDLPDIVQNVAKLFADDIKLYATVNNTNDEIKLQGDIDRLMQWSKDWLLTFNKSKCKHVHFGPPNKAKYQMGGDIDHHPIHRRERPWYHYRWKIKISNSHQQSNKKGQPKTRNDKKKLYIHGQEYVYHTIKV